MCNDCWLVVFTSQFHFKRPTQENNDDYDDDDGGDAGDDSDK